MRRRKYTVPKVDGGFPRKHRLRVDADLIAPAAFHSDRVRAFMEFVTLYWRPKGDILLLSPCSNVKPYPLSPLNRKVEAALKRSGSWDRVEWVFISDLLGPVPYEYTWVPPACCYEARPHAVPGWWLELVKGVVAGWWGRVRGYFNAIIAFLPKKYYSIAAPVLRDAVIVRYDIFRGQKGVEEALSRILRGLSPLGTS